MKYIEPEFEIVEMRLLDVIRTSDPNATLNPLPSNPGGELDGDF